MRFSQAARKDDRPHIRHAIRRDTFSPGRRLTPRRFLRMELKRAGHAPPLHASTVLRPAPHPVPSGPLSRGMTATGSHIDSYLLRGAQPPGEGFSQADQLPSSGEIYYPSFSLHFSLFPLLLKSKNSSPWSAFALHGEVFLSCFGRDYFAYSMALVSRMTLTLIWPGYSSSASIFLAMSRARRIILSSVTSSGFTMIRTSRPAWMA